MRKLIAIIVLMTSTGIGLAACGSNDSPTSQVKGPSTIKVGSSSLGDVLVDGSGRTLYLFTEDGNNTNSMNCDAACVKLWPPLKGKPKAGDGVDASLIGVVTGTDQATYAGHPLYRYAKDSAPGDVNGQGIDKIWYVPRQPGQQDHHGADRPWRIRRLLQRLLSR